MKKPLQYLLPVILILSISCNRSGSNDKFTVTGKIDHGKGNLILLRELGLKEIRTLDSTTIGPGATYSLSSNIKETGFFVLEIKGEKIVLVGNPGASVTVNGDITKPAGTYEILGSEESSALRDFLAESQKNINKTDSLKFVLEMHEDQNDFYALNMKTDSIFGIISNEQAGIEKKFIEAHPRSIANLIVINFTLGAGPVLTYDKDSNLYNKIDEELTAAFPGNKHVVYNHQRIEEIRKQDELNKERLRVQKK